MNSQQLTSRRYLRGDSFADKHWIDLFRLIDIPKATPIETLTLDHFLSVSDKVLITKKFIVLHLRLFSLTDTDGADS